MWTWLFDNRLKKLVRYAGYLTAGTTVGSVFSFLAVAVAARVLGAGRMGQLAQVQSYVAIVAAIFKTQSWQMVIKYGGEALAGKRDREYLGVCRLALYLDLVTAGCGFLAAVLGAHTLGRLWGWDVDVISMAVVYSVTVLTVVTGPAVGALRLHGRFDLLAVQATVASSVKLVGSLVAALLQSGLWAFVLIWALSELLAAATLWILSRRELHRNFTDGIRPTSVRSLLAAYPDILHFAWSTSLNGTVRMVSKEVDLLLVGSILGDEASGLYKVAKQFSLVIGKLSDPLYQTVYPELVKLWAKNSYNEFAKVVLRTGALAGAGGLAVWLAFVIWGKWMIAITVGSEYSSAYSVTVWYMFAVALAALTTPLTPAILAMGRPRTSFAVLTISTAIYLTLLGFLLGQFGITGAGMAYTGFYVLWGVPMAWIVWRGVGRREASWQT